MKPAIRSLVAFAVLALVATSPAGAQSIQVFGCNGHPSCAPVPNANFTALAVGNYHWMGLKHDGSVVGWGMCDVEQCTTPLPNSGFLKIAAGDSHSLGLRPGGVIEVWGSNEAGQWYVPEPNNGFVAMSAGLLHSMAIRSDGSIACWGGVGSFDECDVPEPNAGWIAVAGGGFRSVGVRADGSIHKWGCNGPCPGPPEPNSGFVAAATSHRHSLGLKADGSIVAWGDNEEGQLDVPEPNSGFTAIAAGEHYSLALRSDGTVACFGSAWCNGLPSPNANVLAVGANTNNIPAVLRADAPCQFNEDCDDGVFCNGGEACNAGVCVPGPAPCSAPLFCRESDDACVQCLSDANCDDGAFCNGAETCSAAGSCLAGADPCPGLGCNEEVNACVGGAQVWMSFTGNIVLPGINVGPRDIAARSLVVNQWSLIFEGSDVGLTGLAIDGMARLADGSILLSFTTPANIPGMTGGPSGTALDDADIVRFVPTSLGATTAGAFVFYFDGSDVGLSSNNENVDAIALAPNGDLLISTSGSVSAGRVNGGDADLLRFSATSLGANTAGTFTLYFDGSDVGLADGGDEDVDGAGAGPNGTLLLSTLGAFAVPGVSGADEDVLQFTPSQLGPTTSGAFGMFLDLGALGIPPTADVGALELVP